MRIITIKNPIPLNSPFTIVSTDYTSGISLLVEDSSGFKDNDLILVGGLGNEKAETTNLSGNPPSIDSVTISALDHEHSSDESIQCVTWDKFDVDYKTDSTGNWISLVDANPFDWSNNESNYIHSDGASNYYYRVRYYNSAKDTYSDWSEQVSGIGNSRFSVSSMVYQVRENAKDKTNQKASDELIISYFNFAQDIIKSMNKKWPWLQGEAIVNPTTLALPVDFKRAYRLKYNYINDTQNKTYYLTYLPLPEFEDKYSDNTAATNDVLVNYSIDNINKKIKIGPLPTTTTASLTLVYEKDIIDLEAFTDVTVVPLPELLIAYASAKVWKLKSNPDEYTSWMSDFSDLLLVLDEAKPVSYHPRTLKRFVGRGVYATYHRYSEDTE
jgi:hypothetical protein